MQELQLNPSESPANDKRCDLCDGTQFEQIGNLDRHGAPLQTDLCLQCGLVMHASIPKQNELDAFYANDYRFAYHGERTPSDRRVWRAWKNGFRIAKRLADVLPHEASVMEVGAGLGCTVKALHDIGIDSTGIEPHGEFQRFARHALGVPVSRGSIDDLPRNPTYDAVLMVHVIEHLRSPRQALQRLHTMLRDDGLLYVECPNFAGPFATAKRWFHYAHIHNFTPRTLRWMAARCGFELVQCYVGDEHPDVQMLFRRTTPDHSLTFPRNAAHETLAAAKRYGWLRYHLRPAYLARRVQKLRGYASEYLWARRRVASLCRHGRLRTTSPQLDPMTASVIMDVKSTSPT